MTKIKICGFTDADVARATALSGADAIGLVFYDPSPRNVSIEVAREIVAALPPLVNRIGLFVNASPSQIDEVLCEVPLDTLQFHGDETPLDCEQYHMPFIKAIRVTDQTNLTQVATDFSQASSLLLDAYNPNAFGGTGESFDWSLAKVEIDLPIILAGGLTSENVTDAIAQVSPYAVDVSSGVESAKGVKDIDKIRDFISKVRP